MKGLVKSLAKCVMGVAVLSSSAYAYSPDCRQVDRETYVLKFYGESVASYGGTKAIIPLKRTLRDNCFGINRDDLQNVKRVAVVAESFRRRSAVSVFANGFESYEQFIRPDGTRNRAVFDLGRRGTYGKLQILVRGDINLYKVRVKLNTSRYPGPAPRPTPSTFDVMCSSLFKTYAFCPVSGLVRGELKRKLSDSSCREGRSYWFTRDGIHVDRGCRAIFKVTVR